MELDRETPHDWAKYARAHPRVVSGLFACHETVERFRVGMQTRTDLLDTAPRCRERLLRGRDDDTLGAGDDDTLGAGEDDALGAGEDDTICAQEVDALLSMVTPIVTVERAASSPEAPPSLMRGSSSSTVSPIVWLVLMRSSDKVAVSFEDHVRIVSELIGETCAALDVAMPASLQAGWSDAEPSCLGLDADEMQMMLYSHRVDTRTRSITAAQAG